MLTYGFEIEGVVASTAMRKLSSSARKLGASIDSGYDGSVNRESLAIAASEPTIDGSEFRIGTFSDREKMLTMLSLFENGKNYWSDAKCGLHLHMGTARDDQDDELLRALQPAYNSHATARNPTATERNRAATSGNSRHQRTPSHTLWWLFILGSVWRGAYSSKSVGKQTGIPMLPANSERIRSKSYPTCERRMNCATVFTPG